MTRAHQQRNVAVVLTAALLAVLAVVVGAHTSASRQHRTSAAPSHVASAGPLVAQHVTEHDAPPLVQHLDLTTGPVDPWSPRRIDVSDTTRGATTARLLTARSSHDSRAPPTA